VKVKKYKESVFKHKVGQTMTESLRDITRRYVIEKLPEGLSPSDDHLQIYENYIGDTRLRLKSERRPSTDERRKFLELIEVQGPAGVREISRLLLHEDEYAALGPLRGREVRKNRYRYELDGVVFDIDVFLGPLWGLNIATVRFASIGDYESFEPPAFLILEVTENPDFEGSRLAELDFQGVREGFQKAKGGG